MSAIQQLMAGLGGAPQYMVVTTSGATVTTSGDYKTATYNGSGTFVVTQLGSGPGALIYYLFVPQLLPASATTT